MNIKPEIATIDLNISAKVVLAAAQENPRTTRDDLRQILNMTDRGVAEVIVRLKEAGLLTETKVHGRGGEFQSIWIAQAPAEAAKLNRLVSTDERVESSVESSHREQYVIGSNPAPVTSPALPPEHTSLDFHGTLIA